MRALANMCNRTEIANALINTVNFYEWLVTAVENYSSDLEVLRRAALLIGNITSNSAERAAKISSFDNKPTDIFWSFAYSIIPKLTDSADLKLLRYCFYAVNNLSILPDNIVAFNNYNIYQMLGECGTKHESIGKHLGAKKFDTLLHASIEVDCVLLAEFLIRSCGTDTCNELDQVGSTLRIILYF